MTEPLEPGYLLRELGYDDEIEAAASINVTPKTLTEYRKAGVGPVYVEVARKIYYSKEARAEWLANGGTRQADAGLRSAPPPARAAAAPGRQASRAAR